MPEPVTWPYILTLHAQTVSPASVVDDQYQPDCTLLNPCVFNQEYVILYKKIAGRAIRNIDSNMGRGVTPLLLLLFDVVAAAFETGRHGAAEITGFCLVLSIERFIAIGIGFFHLLSIFLSGNI